MAVIISATRQPLDATQQGSLRKLFDSPEFSLLKELVVSRCISHQVAAMSAELYPSNPKAIEDAGREKASAVTCSDLLDLLDDLQKQEQEWWTIKIEPHR